MLVPVTGRGKNKRSDGRRRPVAVRRTRYRAVAGRARRLVAAGLAPVVAAGTSLVAVATAAAAVTSGAAAVSVAAAPAAKAATSGQVLILTSSVNGGASSAEAAAATFDGYQPVLEPASSWDAITTTGGFTSLFSAYKAVIIGDPSTTTCASTQNDAWGNRNAWGPAVTGNVSVLGTAPALAGSAGTALIRDAIAYAASASAGTGLYISLDCDYSATSYVNSDAGILDGVSGGGFTVTGHVTGSGPACTDSGTVNTWQAQASGSFAGFTSSSLAASLWGGTACPVQESFGAWPGNFTPVAFDASATPASYTASTGVPGQAYALLGTPALAPQSPTLSLNPGTGGRIGQGTNTGGSNPAAPGATQAFNSGQQGSGSSGGGVNTENGDYAQTASDFSVPGFGPSLSLDRTYDSQAAQAGELTGTPGPMGYGWTSNWASSVTASSPIPGDIYAIDGIAGAANTETGLTQYAADGQAPGSAPLGAPGGMLVNGGNVYYSDTQGNRVIEVPGTSGTQWGIQNMVAGDAYTIAGSYTGQIGLWSQLSGSHANQVLLAAPGGLAMDSAGDLLIANAGGAQVDKVTPAGAISTVAGSGSAGTGADGVAATSSALSSPAAVAVDSSGNVYIADAGNNRIQEIAKATGSQWGQSMTAGDIYTVAGSASGATGAPGQGHLATTELLAGPQSVTADSAGDLYIADTGHNRVIEVPKAAGSSWGYSMSAWYLYTVAGSAAGTAGYTGDGSGAYSAALLHGPGQVIVDGSDDMIIADTANNRVQFVPKSAGTFWGQSRLAGDMYTIAGSATAVSGNSGNGGAGTAALLNAPGYVTLDGPGNIYIADTANNAVRKLTNSTLNITAYAGNGQDLASAGNGGPAVNGSLVKPGGEVADSHGDIYVTDSQNNRVQEIAAYTHTQWGINMTGGDVYTIAGWQHGQGGCCGDGAPAVNAQLSDPQGLAFDNSGNLLIADFGNQMVRVVAAGTGTFYGQSMTAGDIYVIAGSPGVTGTSGDGGPAKSGLLNRPYGLAVDTKGDVFIADKDNHRIQEIFAAGGHAFGQSMTANDIYTVAGSSTGTSGNSGDGSAATAAKLNAPQGLAVDAGGDLIISDTSNEQVRMVPVAGGSYYGQKMTANDIYTLAGSTAGTAGSAGDGGPASASQLHTPVGLATDPAGDVYIADGANDRIREIAAVSGIAWETQMTATDIYTVAGTGAANSSGDGGPAYLANVYFAVSSGTDNYGDLYIGDQSGGQLREITSSTPATIKPAPGLTSALYPAPGSSIGSTTYPAGITVTQPGGAQVTFYPKTGGTCAQPMVPAGGYCVMPQFPGATLTANGTSSYTFSPSPGADSYTYSWAGNLTAVTDPAGESLTVTTGSPAPGGAVAGDASEVCPATVGGVTTTSCETVTAASGRALVLGFDGNGQVTSVTDPMGRQWTYAYNGCTTATPAVCDLVSVTDPMSNRSTYGYDTGNTSPLLAADLLTVTTPNAQPGGPDAGKVTIIGYNPAGQATAVTDPMGSQTTYNYCVNQQTHSCMNAATGSGLVTVTDPGSNATVYGYVQGVLASQTAWTGAVGTTLSAQSGSSPDTTISTTAPSYCSGTDAGGTDGSLLPNTSYDGDLNTTSFCYDAAGNQVQENAPSPAGSGQAVTTTGYSTTAGLQGLDTCDTTAESATACSDGNGPAPVAPAGVITPPSSAPPAGVTWGLYDTDGNQLYTTAGVYAPSGTYEYSQTTYQLFKGNSITLGSNHVTCTYTPPSMTNPCATINADGIVTQLKYNTQGDLALSSTPDGNSGGELATTTYTYDPDGEQVNKTLPDGNIAGANAGNYTSTKSWNADGQERAITYGNGTGYTDTPRTTSYGYDGNGNQTTVQDARTYTTTTAYNADDQATLVTDPDGNATLTCYDNEGNTVETVPPIGVAASNLTPASCPVSFPADYNPANKPPLASDATLYAFDADGNQTATYTPAPAGQAGYETTTYTYDPDGNLVTTTAPPTSNGGSSQVTVDTYNLAGQLAAQTSGYGSSAPSTISYCYDPDGDTTSVVYADGNASGTATCGTSSPWTVTASPQVGYQTTYSYDSAGQLVTTTTPATAAAPSGATTRASYDASGNMLTSTDPAGVQATWTYTAADQPATVTYSGSSAHSVGYSYDADGARTGMTDATGSSAFQYDPFGELTSAQNGASQTTGYGYDADGQTSSVTYPLPAGASWASTSTVAYGYDHADVLTSVTDFNGHQLTIGNTADAMPNSVTLGSSGDAITTSYDPTDAPSAISLKNSTSTLQSFTYTDAQSGDLLNETDTPVSAQSPAVYTYDAQGRVASDTAGTGSASNYQFDRSGNLTTLPAGASTTYDKAGELTSSTLAGTTTNYAYNADGQRLTVSQGSTTLASGTWNGAAQLTGYSSQFGTMTAATYDGDGMRASATMTPSGGSAVTSAYVWNGDSLLMDASNAYVYADGTAPAEQVNLTTGATTYLVTDSLGSVRGAVDSSGALTGTTGYDAWGNPQTTGGLTATTPFGYAGGYTDPTGLMYLINRYYNPSTGQFTSVDPDLADTVAPYSYAAGNPVSNSDPNGEHCLPYPECAKRPPPVKTFSEKEHYAFFYLMQQLRLKNFQSAAIVGNLWWESNLDPTQKQLGCPGNGFTACGIGIAQWTYWPNSQAQRWHQEETFARRQHASKFSFLVQVQFVRREFNLAYRNTLLLLRKSRRLPAATSIVQTDYEGGTDFSDRQNRACKVLHKYYKHASCM